MTAPVDYDLHGLAGVRLIDAAPPDAAAVDRQLGPIRRALERPPDIVVRFVDRLPVDAPLRYLGLDDVAFTADAFLVLRARHKSRARVRIPLQDVGRRCCEIVCERGAASVPLLVPILNLTVLSHGALPLHAAAFVYRGTGVVATGWSKGGKTEALLAFMANGARYVGDEWVYLSADGRRMYGIPEPIRVWRWHLESLPRYRAAVARSDRMRLRLLGAALSTVRLVGADGTRDRGRLRRSIGRLAPLLRQQMCVDVPPERLFGKASCLMQGRPEVVLFVGSHESDRIEVRPVEPQEIARRMVFSLQHEQAGLMSFYLKFRFAFPEACNEVIERSADLQRRALRRVLEGKETFLAEHPYPVSLPALYEALRPCCA